jgi:probable HAF family extracellular repeat protein
MTISLKSLRLLIAIGTLTLAPPAFASRYNNIDYPGAKSSYAWGIGTTGDVVGSYVDTAGTEHGFLLRDGAYTSFDYPGAKWTEIYGINSQGEMVGQYGLPSDPTTHGFVLKNGAFSSLDVAGPTDQGARNSMPFGMTPEGNIIGCYHQSNSTGAIVAGTMRGFALQGSTLTFNVANTMNTGVNPAGDIVGYGTGYAAGASADHGYVLSQGTTTWFSVPNSVFTRPRGISANGDVVGIFQDTATKNFHGFLYRQGSFSTLDVPGATATRPTSMNAVGDIVGYYNDAGGIHAFLSRKTGWWWNSDKPGTGFMMERQGNNMMVTAFVYDYDGTPTWLTASGPVVNGTFNAAAHAYAKGQTLTGAYQRAQDAGEQGILNIQFTDAGTAQLSWVPNPFMSTNMMLQRFGFTGGPGIFGTVENGWWSNPGEPGRSFAIEVQDTNIFIVGSMFDGGGRPTWYLSYGLMTDATTFSGTWAQYGMGPTMMGIGGTPSLLAANAGSLKLKFSDAQNGILTLPDGRQIAITRSSF